MNRSVFCFAFVFLIACDSPGPGQGARAFSAAPRMYTDFPVIEAGVRDWSDDVSAGQRSADEREVLELLRKLVAMLEARDLSGLGELIARERGLYVDYKAHRSYEELQKEIEQPDSYLNTYFLNTDALIAQSGDGDKLAVRAVLRMTRTLKADMYFVEDQCEIRLQLVDAPSRSHYLNHPVFVKEKGVWYILRLL